MINTAVSSDPESVSRHVATWSDEMLSAVYDDLRRLAVAKLSHEAPGQTLQATALVHEAYLRLRSGSPAWDSPGHFFAAAAEAMRRILIERARRKKCNKHGGGRKRVSLEDAERYLSLAPSSENVQSLDDALNKLEAEDAPAASVAKLRIFVGMSLEETAEALGISRAMAYRQWTFARAYLTHEIGSV